MNKRRLLKMADFVETIPREKFDMRQFGNDCGSVGCALGNAVKAKLFRALHRESKTAIGWFPMCGNRWGLGAAEVLFGIDRDAATRLFLPGFRHKTPKQVAKNIRKYVATGELP